MIILRTFMNCPDIFLLFNMRLYITFYFVYTYKYFQIYLPSPMAPLFCLQKNTTSSKGKGEKHKSEEEVKSVESQNTMTFKLRQLQRVVWAGEICFSSVKTNISLVWHLFPSKNSSNIA